jgi:hypothetical protein
VLINRGCLQCRDGMENMGEESVIVLEAVWFGY